MCSRAVTRYSATEGTEKDLRYTLVSMSMELQKIG